MDPKFAPMKPSRLILAAIRGTNVHRLSSGWLANQYCAAATAMKANSATWLTRRAPNRSTMRLFDQFEIAMQPAQMAKIMGNLSPAPKASPINCWLELMKPNKPPKTSALPRV